MLLDDGVGVLSKVLKAYMGEAALPTDPIQSIFGNYALGCVVLLRQHDDQFKSGLSWMEIHTIPY